MSRPEIIAIITPKPGKTERVQELLTAVANAVQANEPGTLRYQLQRETKGDNPSFVMLETYKDQAALEIHGKGADYKNLGRALKKEDLLAAPIKVIFTKEVGGFASKL